MLSWSLCLLLLAAVVAQAVPAAAQAHDPSAWRDYPIAMPGDAVKGVTDRFPLSDQANRAGWVRYEAMSDEFGGSRLDFAKWLPTNPTWKGRQPGLFSPGNVQVADGGLQLTMRAQEPPDALRAEGYHTYTSAAVQSKGTVLYGYFEVRAKPMRSAGSSAFWFYKQDPDRWTEIDVFEIGGGAPAFARKLFMTVHVFHTPTEKEHWQILGDWNAPFELAGDYHVYGLEWDEQYIRYYFDGRLVREGPNTHWHQPLTMNFDSETMPDWFGLPRLQDLPSTFSVDYVRAWKRATGQSTDEHR